MKEGNTGFIERFKAQLFAPLFLKGFLLQVPSMALLGSLLKKPNKTTSLFLSRNST